MAETPPTVDQPTWRPTNKLMAGTLVGLLSNIAFKLIDHYGISEWIGADAALLREVVGYVISALVGGVYAYFFIKDSPNQTEIVAALKAAIVRTPGAVMPVIATKET